MPKIDLIVSNTTIETPTWQIGDVLAWETIFGDLDKQTYQLQISDSNAWLFWDSKLGHPCQNRVQTILGKPSHINHAGLCLGTSSLPRLIDFVTPTWMLNHDPPLDIEATSWRTSLRACLVHTEVLKQIGFVRPKFDTLIAAALEWGHRCITHGVIMRHTPQLLPHDAISETPAMPFEDELRFVYYRFGRMWAIWALFRALLTGYTTPLHAAHAWRKINTAQRPPEPAPFQRNPTTSSNTPKLSIPKRHNVNQPTVSVLIPTLDRYQYLRKLLDQLGDQTIPPLEVIVVDQTPLENRQTDLREEFINLPLKWLYLDQAGQCSSRNAGLKVVKGDFILFIDDDDEVPRTLIENHLQALNTFHADVSSGVADEVGAGPLPDSFTYTRISDVFPTNNTLIAKSILTQSGLFDLAYNHGSRADGDLGMRIYLSGALMMLVPSISVLHHHAARGGLRAHKARIITYASSRKYLMQRHLPTTTEIYLAKRYFSPHQVREALALRVFGTFSLRGLWWRKILKVMLSGLLLPDTLWRIRGRVHQATKLLHRYPQIPSAPLRWFL